MSLNAVRGESIDEVAPVREGLAMGTNVIEPFDRTCGRRLRRAG